MADMLMISLLLRKLKRIVQGLKHQNDVLAKGIPWMDPFSNLTSECRTSGYSIAKTFIRIRDNFENKRVMIKNCDVPNIQSKENLLSKKRICWENLDTHHAVTPEIPRFIHYLLKESYNTAKAPLSGVSILSTIPIKQINELNRY